MKTYVPKAGSVLAAVVTLSISSFVLAACGSGGGGLSSEDQALADAIANDVETDTDGLVDESQGQCFGETVVKDLGADRLAELGVTLDSPGGFGESDESEPTDAEVDKVIDAYDKCADIRDLLTKTLENEMSEDAAKCTVDKLSDADLREIIRVGILDTAPSNELTTKMAAGMKECGGVG